MFERYTVKKLRPVLRPNRFARKVRGVVTGNEANVSV